MQFVNEILVYVNDKAQYIKGLLTAVYVEHPNAYRHVLFTMAITLIILTNLRIRILRKWLNEMDKRYTVLLLTIQTYCTSLNRAVNEVLEKSDKNTQLILNNDAKTISLIRLAHQRVKDAYTGLFKHLDIKKLKRAHKGDMQQSTEESTERNELLREAINEMMVTDFSANH